MLTKETTMLRMFVVVAVALGVTACATPPATYAVKNSRSYQKSYDTVWEDVVSFLATNNLQIKNIAKDSGVIYAEAVRFEDNVADCGEPGILRVVGRRASFNIFINRSGRDPIVSVNTEFNEMRRFDSNVSTVQCNSKGLLEEKILNSISG